MSTLQTATVPPSGDTMNMSVFKDAVFDTLRRQEDITFGENGHAEYTRNAVGEPLLAFYADIIRGLSEEEVREHIHNCITHARAENNTEMIVNVIVLLFQTRWNRGGKGEKKIFYTMYKILYEYYPSTMIDLLSLIPEYGYWKDFLLLLKNIKCSPVNGVDYSPFAPKIWSMFADQLFIDLNIMIRAESTGEIPQLSFCAKWAASEGTEFDTHLNAVSETCKKMYPHLNSLPCKTDADKKLVSAHWRKSKADYRKLVTSLRKKLEVPEVKMCAQEFSKINVAKITSNCFSKNMDALLNEKLNQDPIGTEEETGNRYPDNEDRIACRNNILEHIVSGRKINGKQLHPHELVKKALNRPSTAKKKLTNAQWGDLLNSVKEQIQTAIPEGNTDIICMSDVSGSMMWEDALPIKVSIAMGILCSQLTSSSFKDLVMTFSTDPTWHDLSGALTFVDKVSSLQGADVGFSTDFKKAMGMILKMIVTKKIPHDQVPKKFLIVSDMQMDKADKNSDPLDTEIKKGFQDIGMEPPTIIFLNVRSGSVGYPTTADNAGTMLLSGWSPSVFKTIFLDSKKEDEVLDELTGEVKTVKCEITPMDALYSILNDKGLSAVRAAIEGRELN